MKRNKYVSLVIGIQGIFVPISVFLGSGSVISLANISMVFEQSVFVGITFIIETVLLFSYSVTYVYAAFKSFEKDEISFVSFLPAIHVAITVFVYLVSAAIEQRYLI